MTTVRITGIQMKVEPTKKENLPRILKDIQETKSDFILFPQMSLTGYTSEFSTQRTQEAWRQIGAACRLAYTTAIIGTGARDNGNTFIQARVYGDEGALVGTQEKIVPTEKERQWCRPGDELRVFQKNGLAYGCLICNDLWVRPGLGPYPDPRLSYQLAQKGAHIIFHGVDSGSDPRFSQYHEANLKLRAIESGCYIVTVNAASSNGPLNSPSGIVSPTGEWLVQAPTSGEQVFQYDLELDIL